MPTYRETTFPLGLQGVYDFLSGAAKFVPATGKAATTDEGKGSTFSIFEGYIQGREVTFVADHECSRPGMEVTGIQVFIHL